MSTSEQLASLYRHAILLCRNLPLIPGPSIIKLSAARPCCLQQPGSNSYSIIECVIACKPRKRKNANQSSRKNSQQHADFFDVCRLNLQYSNGSWTIPTSTIGVSKDLEMATIQQNQPSLDVKAARVGLKLVLMNTEAMFEHRRALTERCYAKTLDTGKKVLRKSQREPETRFEIPPFDILHSYLVHTLIVLMLSTDISWVTHSTCGTTW